MATTIRELVVKLGIDADTAALSKFESGVSDMKSSLAALATAGIGAAAAVAAVAVSTATAGDNASKGGQRIGESAETYQELAFAAERSGTSISTLETALLRQAGALSELESGTGKAGEALDSLGISARDSNGDLKSNSALLEEVATALVGVTDEQERLRLAQDIYGSRLAGQLIPLLSEGGDGIAALRQQARDLGGVMSDEAAANSVAFADALTDLKTIAGGLKNTLGAELLPVLTELAREFSAWFAENRDEIVAGVREFAAALISMIRRAAEAVAFVVDALGGWRNAAAAVAAVVAALGAAFVGSQIVTFVIGLVSAISGLVGFISSVGLPVILAVAGAAAYLVAWFAAAALVVQDLWTYFQGGDSVVGRILERFEGLRSALEGVGAVFSALYSLVEALIPVLSAVGRLWWWIFSNTTLPVLQAIAAVIAFIADVALAGLGAYLEFVAARIQALAGFVGALVDGASGLAGLFGGGELAGGEGDVVDLTERGDGSFGLEPSEAALGGGGGASTTNSVVVEGGTTTITTGADPNEVREVVLEIEAERNRQAIETFEGAEA